MHKLMSRALPAIISLLLVAPALAQNTDTKDYPPAWPRKGATTLIDNDRIAAYNVTYPINQPTPMHRHRYPVAGLDLNTATLRVTTPAGKTSVHAVVRGRMWYLQKGTLHQETSLTDPGRHTVVVDIKDKTVPAAENKTNYPSDKFADGGIKVVDNDRVTTWDCAWGENAPAVTAFDSRDILLAFTDGGQLSIATDGGAPKMVTVASGQALFLPGGKVRAISSVKGTIRAMLVEVK